MEEDFEGGGVGGENNEFGNTTVECFGRCGEVWSSEGEWWGKWGGRYTFIGTLLQLAVVGRLLDEVEKLLRQRGIGKREG